MQDDSALFTHGATADIPAGYSQHGLADRLLLHFRFLHERIDDPANEGNCLSFAGVGQKAEVPDLNEAGRQYVEEEAADKLLAADRHAAFGVAVFPVLVAEGHLVAVDGLQTMIVDGHPVRVSPQIFQNLLGSGKGSFEVDNPFPPTGPVQRRQELILVPLFRQLQLALGEEIFQALKVVLPKTGGQGLGPEEIVPAGMNPAIALA